MNRTDYLDKSNIRISDRCLKDIESTVLDAKAKVSAITQRYYNEYLMNVDPKQYYETLENSGAFNRMKAEISDVLINSNRESKSMIKDAMYATYRNNYYATGYIIDKATDTNIGRINDDDLNYAVTGKSN